MNLKIHKSKKQGTTKPMKKKKKKNKRKKYFYSLNRNMKFNKSCE